MLLYHIAYIKYLYNRPSKAYINPVDPVRVFHSIGPFLFIILMFPFAVPINI